jgi:hypothetical protein
MIYERTCVQCGNPLSIYNDTNKCFCHSVNENSVIIYGYKSFGPLPSNKFVLAVRRQYSGGYTDQY